MSDPKSRLYTRVEVFTRATTDALNRAIGEVLDARSPWQLLYRLSRIVFLGLVLYLGWILVVVQPACHQPLLHADLRRQGLLPQRSHDSLDAATWLKLLQHERLLLPAPSSLLVHPPWRETGLIALPPADPLWEVRGCWWGRSTWVPVGWRS